MSGLVLVVITVVVAPAYTWVIARIASHAFFAAKFQYHKRLIAYTIEEERMYGESTTVPKNPGEASTQ